MIVRPLCFPRHKYRKTVQVESSGSIQLGTASDKSAPHRERQQWSIAIVSDRPETGFEGC
jgi:hypothetical protein